MTAHNVEIVTMPRPGGAHVFRAYSPLTAAVLDTAQPWWCAHELDATSAQAARESALEDHEENIARGIDPCSSCARAAELRAGEYGRLEWEYGILNDIARRLGWRDTGQKREGRARVISDRMRSALAEAGVKQEDMP